MDISLHEVLKLLLIILLCQCCWPTHGNYVPPALLLGSPFPQNPSPVVTIPTNTQYHDRAVLDPQGRYILEWTMDKVNSRAFFNITAKTTGWVGLGLTRRGSMKEADMVIGGVGPGGRAYLSDMHSDCDRKLFLDGQQDWKLFSASESSPTGWTNLVIYRDFETCDDDDYPITVSQIFLIWAYGETDLLEDHLNNRGSFRAFLLDPVSHQTTESLVRPWSFRSNVTLPPKETHFSCYIHRGPRQLPTKQHIVQLDPYLGSSVAVAHTKHILLWECVAPPGTSASQIFEPLVGYEEECYFITNRRIPINLCRTLISAWSVGGGSIVLDPSTGIEFGGGEQEQQQRYYMTETNFNNPELLPGITLETGMDVLYTPNLRQNDGGSFIFGYDLFGTFVIPPVSHAFRVQAHCTADCTSQMLPSEGIQILGVIPHFQMVPGSGGKIVMRHFRGNKELPNVIKDDNYDTTFQQYRLLPEPVSFLPGDQLLLDCTYDTTWTNVSVLNGFSNRQEMCQSWVMTTKRIPTFSFSSKIPDTKVLNSIGVSNLAWDMNTGDKLITAPPLLKGTLLQDYSDGVVEWRKELRSHLQQDMLLTSPQVGSCPSNVATPGMDFYNIPVVSKASTDSAKIFTLGGGYGMESPVGGAVMQLPALPGGVTRAAAYPFNPAPFIEVGKCSKK